MQGEQHVCSAAAMLNDIGNSLPPFDVEHFSLIPWLRLSMSFRLRYMQHDFALSLGRFAIGRSPDCQLSLDDPLVSRRHALLVVAQDWVEVQDLGSRNGVLVNGQRIEQSRRVSNGDRITIGSQEMTLVFRQHSVYPLESGRPAARQSSETITSLAALNSSRVSDPDIRQTGRFSREITGPTDKSDASKAQALRLLGGVAEKALALKRSEEAERLLSAPLQQALQILRDGGELEASLVDEAGRFGAKLARATGKGSWIDYVVELHTLAGRPCIAATIDELHAVLRKVKDLDIVALRAYVQMLRDAAPSLGPNERFLVQRIEGLAKIV
jgi:hypothetical protein